MQVRSKDKYDLAVKRHEQEVSWERDQVKRLKDENRRLMIDQRNAAVSSGFRNKASLDSSYQVRTSFAHFRLLQQTIPLATSAGLF